MSLRSRMEADPMSLFLESVRKESRMALSVHEMTRKEALLAELARDVTDAPARVPPPPSDPVLAKFNKLGTHLWLDTGNLDEASKLWRLEMSALTTNNTL